MRWLLAVVVAVVASVSSVEVAQAIGCQETGCNTNNTGCDAPDFCNMTTFQCEARFDPAGTVCNPATAGTCQTSGVCSGSSTTCGPKGAQPAGVECRASAGLCDVAEVCPGGGDDTCPANGFRGAGFECRAAVNDCDVAETCAGGTASCPADGKKANDSPCNDGDVCTAGDTCQSAVCQPGGPRVIAVPTTVDFPGALLNGSPTMDSVVLTYRGNTTIDVTAISPTLADFTLAPSVSLPITLTTSTRDATVALEFSPAAIGTREGNLQVTLDPNNCPAPVITLSGEGLPPGVSVTPSSIDFSQAMVGTSSLAREIDVINLSDVPINVTSVTLGDSTHFVLGASGLPAALSVGQTYTFTVVAAPTSLGVQTTNVVVTTNHPSFPTFMTSLRVEGTDVPPTVDAGVLPDSAGPGPGADPTEVLTPLSCKVQKGDGLAGFLVLVAFGLVLRSLYRRS